MSLPSLPWDVPRWGWDPLSAHSGDVSPCLCDTAGVLGSSSTSGPAWMVPTLKVAHLSMDSLYVCYLQPSLLCHPLLLARAPGHGSPLLCQGLLTDPITNPHVQRLWNCTPWMRAWAMPVTLGAGQSAFTTPWHPAPQKGLKSRTTIHQCVSQTCSFPMAENFSYFNTINNWRRVAASPWKCTDCKQFFIYRNNNKKL